MDIINSKLPIEGAVDTRQGGRPENQDDFGYVDTPLGLLVAVCDGMGGGPGGKTASYLAKMAIMETVYKCNEDDSREEILSLAIDNAHHAILKKVQEFPELRGMGTTAVILLINEESAVVCHVGDSRAYKIRGVSKVFRTNDHSMVGEMVRSGTLTEEQARLSAQSNIITQAIGGAKKPEPEFDKVAFEKGDRFVLCTDGIWGTMPEPELVKKFGQKKQIPVLCESLTAEIDNLGKNNGGHHDNLTVAILVTKTDSKLKESMNRKAKQLLFGLALLCAISLIGNLVGCSDKNRKKTLEQEVSQLQNELKEKDSLMKAKDISLKDAKNKNADFKSERENSQSTIKSLTQICEDLKKQNESLKEENEKLKKSTSNVSSSRQSSHVNEKRNCIDKTINAVNKYNVSKNPLDKKNALDALNECANKISETRYHVDDIKSVINGDKTVPKKKIEKLRAVKDKIK